MEQISFDEWKKLNKTTQIVSSLVPYYTEDELKEKK